MKSTAITIWLLASASVGYSQGTINWSDYQPANSDMGPLAWSITVFSPGEVYTGYNPGGPPSGTGTAYAMPLGYSGSGSGPTGYGKGGNYDIGLYVDTTQALVQNDVLTGSPAAVANFAIGSGGWDFSGALYASTAFPSGTAVYVELAAWYNGGGNGTSTGFGSITSYQAASVAGVPAGIGNVSTGTTMLGSAPTSASGTLAGIGLQDFGLATAVPEPGTMALGILGAWALLMRLRGKGQMNLTRQH